MAKLQISDRQHKLIIGPPGTGGDLNAGMNNELEDAFLEGTDAPTEPDLLPKLMGYDSAPAAPYRQIIKDSYRSLVAALIKVLDIHGPLPASWTNGATPAKFTGTVILAPLTVVPGSLTVVDGIITAYSPPS